MINRIKSIAATLLLLLITGGTFAQDKAVAAATTSQPPVDMATGLYQSGKIYVVVGVLVIIFAGILAYLVMLDRKVSRIEKEIGNK